MVAEDEAQHPGQKVSPLFVKHDNRCKKVLPRCAAADRRTLPTSFLYGSWGQRGAGSQVVNSPVITKKRPAVKWDAFGPASAPWPPSNGKVIGIPAVVDTCRVHTRRCSAKAGLRRRARTGPGSVRADARS